jgi:hypothetical protein
MRRILPLSLSALLILESNARSREKERNGNAYSDTKTANVGLKYFMRVIFSVLNVQDRATAGDEA